MGSPSIRREDSSFTSKNNILHMSSIASFLDHTLSKLKGRKPNQRNLKPIDDQVLLKFQ